MTRDEARKQCRERIGKYGDLATVRTAEEWWHLKDHYDLIQTQSENSAFNYFWGGHTYKAREETAAAESAGIFYCSNVKEEANRTCEATWSNGDKVQSAFTAIVDPCSQN